jgi:hypothetical protein
LVAPDRFSLQLIFISGIVFSPLWREPYIELPSDATMAVAVMNAMLKDRKWERNRSAHETPEAWHDMTF